MNVFIVFAHPSKQSYTYRILEELKNTLLQKNFSVEVSDLYAMNFRCDMTEHEYNRESLNQYDLPIPPDIQREHKKIERADCIIFLYPVWWSDCPAKLKGWFDRVYTVGYAYKQRDDKQKMKFIKYGVALCTAGYSNDHLHETGMAYSMQQIMLDDRFGKRFEHNEMMILGGTLERDKVEETHIKQVKELVKRLESHQKKPLL
jgi:NAD(P)H dehydrogenase (quinone)